jgi:hypothetical protein
VTPFASMAITVTGNVTAGNVTASNVIGNTLSPGIINYQDGTLQTTNSLNLDGTRLANTFTQVTTNNQAYSCIASSVNGQYVTAGVANGNLYTSSMYGASNSWYPVGPSSQNWTSVSISATGQYQTATVYNSTTGNIYISSNYGLSNTWYPTGLSTLPTNNAGFVYQSVAVSATGQYQTVVSSVNNGYIFTSTAYGALNTWNISVTYLWFNSVSMSSNGQYQTAAILYSTNAGNIYTSNNYGQSWNLTAPASLSWSCVSVSSSGKYQTAIAYNNNIYISTNYGALNSWYATGPSTQNWYYCSVSSTGQYQIASITNGNIYASSNYGLTGSWYLANTSFTWNNLLSISSNGQYIYGYYNNNLYSCQTPFASMAISGINVTGNVTTTGTISTQLIQFSDNSLLLTNNNNLDYTNFCTSSSTYVPSFGTPSFINLSYNGQYQLACAGYLYVSTNYGSANSWYTSYSSSSYNWASCSVSTTGQYMNALTYNGLLFASTSYGQVNTWFNPLNTGGNSGLFCFVNGTGQYQSAAQSNGGNGTPYISTSYGLPNTWFNTVLINSSWVLGTAVRFSYTGQYALFPAANGNVYTSTNYGLQNTWVIANQSGMYFQSCVMSYSGQYNAISAQNTGNSNCYLYISTNYGKSGSWYTAFTYTGQIGNGVDPFSMSSSGQFITLTTNGTLYVSTNYGQLNSWYAQSMPIGPGPAFSISGNGQYLVGQSNTSGICTSITPFYNMGISNITSNVNITGNANLSGNVTISGNLNSNTLLNANAGLNTPFNLFADGSISNTSSLNLDTTQFTKNWSSVTTFNTTFSGAVALSYTGQYQIAGGSNANLYVSTNYGTLGTWYAVGPLSSNQSWNSVGISSTGQYQTALIYGGNVYTSTNYGLLNTWIAVGHQIKNGLLLVFLQQVNIKPFRVVLVLFMYLLIMVD